MSLRRIWIFSIQCIFLRNFLILYDSKMYLISTIWPSFFLYLPNVLQPLPNFSFKMRVPPSLKKYRQPGDIFCYFLRGHSARAESKTRLYTCPRSNVTKPFTTYTQCDFLTFDTRAPLHRVFRVNALRAVDEKKLGARVPTTGALFQLATMCTRSVPEYRTVLT